MHIKVVDDDTNEEVECEEGAKDNEEDEVQVHHYAVLVDGLVFKLEAKHGVVAYHYKQITSVYHLQTSNSKMYKFQSQNMQVLVSVWTSFSFTLNKFQFHNQQVSVSH